MDSCGRPFLKEEMVSYTNWNKELKDCEGKMTSSLLEKEHLPKLKTSFYVMGSTFLLLCFIFVIVYMLHQGTIVNDVNEQTREIQHSRRPRGSDTRNLLTEDITDNSVEITGNICMGYGTKSKAMDLNHLTKQQRDMIIDEPFHGCSGLASSAGL
ncbi:uncharacterized protein ACNLHF_009299 [Anomaloglossus baeobatrachus]